MTSLPPHGSSHQHVAWMSIDHLKLNYRPGDGTGYRLGLCYGRLGCGFVVNIFIILRYDFHRRCVIIWCASGKRPWTTLVLLYTADIPVIASEHGLGVHCYADDGQLYMSERPGNAGSVISKVTACIDEIDKWMSSNRLKLNSEKTQFIWLGSYQQIQKVTVESIDLAGSTLTFQSSVNDLGVLIDSQLTMREHVQRVCRSSFYQLRQLRVIRSSLSMKTCTALVHAFVTSGLDYCNSLLSGINKELLNRLESVLRSAARLVLRKRKFDPISDDIRNTLHWLPVRQRIEFKLGILVFKCLHGDAPSYLVESLIAGLGQSGSSNTQVRLPR